MKFLLTALLALSSPAWGEEQYQKSTSFNMTVNEGDVLLAVDIEKGKTIQCLPTHSNSDGSRLFECRIVEAIK